MQNVPYKVFKCYVNFSVKQKPKNGKNKKCKQKCKTIGGQAKVLKNDNSIYRAMLKKNLENKKLPKGKIIRMEKPPHTKISKVPKIALLGHGK